MDVRRELDLALRFIIHWHFIVYSLTGFGTRRLGDLISGTLAAAEYCAEIKGAVRKVRRDSMSIELTLVGHDEVREKS